MYSSIELFFFILTLPFRALMWIFIICRKLIKALFNLIKFVFKAIKEICNKENNTATAE